MGDWAHPCLNLICPVGDIQPSFKRLYHSLFSHRIRLHSNESFHKLMVWQAACIINSTVKQAQQDHWEHQLSMYVSASLPSLHTCSGPTWVMTPRCLSPVVHPHSLCHACNCPAIVLLHMPIQQWEGEHHAPSALWFNSFSLHLWLHEEKASFSSQSFSPLLLPLD